MLQELYFDLQCFILMGYKACVIYVILGAFKHVYTRAVAKMKLPIIGLLIVTALSCNRTRETRIDMKSIKNLGIARKQFEKEVKALINRINKGKDSISMTIKLDTTYSLKLRTHGEDYTVYFGQYHTTDRKLNFGIVGVGNSENENIPTYTFLDGGLNKYLVDSINIEDDSLLIFGTTTRKRQRDSFILRFDLKFNGQAFPWSIK